MENAPDNLKISLVYDQAINYAFQQNAIPVVKELRFCNDATPRKNLIIRITTEPAFAEPVELRLQGIDAGGEFRVAPLDLKLSPDFLVKLNEKVSGWLKVEVVEGDSIICSKTEPVSLLARNEWCGLVSLPEILAAFILPNDTAVMTILNRAAELLREHTGRSAFNGYQDKSRRRAWEQVAAIYKAVGSLASVTSWHRQVLKTPARKSDHLPTSFRSASATASICRCFFPPAASRSDCIR